MASRDVAAAAIAPLVAGQKKSPAFGTPALPRPILLDVNPASLGVSRKVGYRPTAVNRIKRREGELALNQGFVLTPETFVRDGEPIRVTGAEAVRSFIGLGAG